MAERVSTHHAMCWDTGPRHYECALRKIEEQDARITELEEAMRLVRADIKNTMNGYPALDRALGLIDALTDAGGPAETGGA